MSKREKKNILLITHDILGPGVGFDVKYSREILRPKYGVTVVHYGTFENNKKGIYSLSMLNIFQKLKFIKGLVMSEKIDFAHIRGLASVDHIQWYSMLLLLKVPYIISPFSQLVEFNLSNKLFYENPDINTSSVFRKKHKTNKFFKSYKVFITPFLKRAYMKTFGYLFIKKSLGLVCFSEFEKKSLTAYKQHIEIVKEPLFELIENSKNACKSFDYYKLDDINIVYWGRLDVNVKGLDRLLEFAKLINQEYSECKIRLHLMGPNYNRGEEYISTKIKEQHLKNRVFLYKESVWRGNTLPLQCADYSILLSRWDGYPRSLRESVSMSVPIIASEETNFWDLINKTNCGYLYTQYKNDQRTLIESIINRSTSLEKECKMATEELMPEKICNDLYESYKRFLQ